MEWIDYIVVAIVAISVLVGALRGLVKEAFSLAVWVVAFLMAFQFSGPLAENLENTITLPSARTALAFAGIFDVAPPTVEPSASIIVPSGITCAPCRTCPFASITVPSGIA